MPVLYTVFRSDIKVKHRALVLLLLSGVVFAVDGDRKEAPGSVGGGGSFQQLGTGAIARSVQDKLRDTVSVKDFGALGDGTANDTAAFAHALAASKSVYVPPGTYKLTSTLEIPSGAHLFGASMHTGASVLRFYGTYPAALRMRGVARILIGNLNIVNSGSVSNGIDMAGSSAGLAKDITIENVLSHNFKVGIEAGVPVSAVNSLVMHLRILNYDSYNDTTGIHLARAIVVRIESGTIVSFHRDAIVIGSPAHECAIKADMCSSHAVAISGVDILGGPMAGDGVKIYNGWAISIDRSYVEIGTGRTGYFVSVPVDSVNADGIAVSSNWIQCKTGGSSAPSDYAIYFNRPGGSLSVRDNVASGVNKAIVNNVNGRSFVGSGNDTPNGTRNDTPTFASSTPVHDSEAGSASTGAALAAVAAPRHSTEACTAGTHAADASYYYYCVSSGVWRRVAWTAGAW
jgi:hypothetical protein